jgi:hypothetical protein
MVLWPMMPPIACCCADARKFARIVAAGIETRQGLFSQLGQERPDSLL